MLLSRAAQLELREVQQGRQWALGSANERGKLRLSAPGQSDLCVQLSPGALRQELLSAHERNRLSRGHWLTFALSAQDDP